MASTLVLICIYTTACTTESTVQAVIYRNIVAYRTQGKL